MTDTDPNLSNVSECTMRLNLGTFAQIKLQVHNQNKVPHLALITAAFRLSIHISFASIYYHL